MAKYIVTRSDGAPIPEDEPCFIIRAKDKFALQAVAMYSVLTWSYIGEKMKDELIAHLDRIESWQEAHKEYVKVPD